MRILGGFAGGWGAGRVSWWCEKWVLGDISRGPGRKLGAFCGCRSILSPLSGVISNMQDFRFNHKSIRAQARAQAHGHRHTGTGTDTSRGRGRGRGTGMGTDAGAGADEWDVKANGGYRNSWMPACSTMMPVVLICGPAESRRHGGGGEKTSPIGFSHGPREAAIVPV